MEKIRSDTCFIAAFFVSPDAHGFVRALGNFVDCNPLVVVADLLVLAASVHLGESEIWGPDRLKCLGLGVACAILILVGFCG